MSILSRRGSINTGSVDTRPGIVNRGFWNANTNTTTDSSFPSLQSGVGVKNYYYVVSVAGTTDLDGITDWQPNDWALFDGTSWEKIDNSEAGSGDVTGPSSAIDNNIATYNSTSGKIIQDGGSKIITEAEGITGNDNDASVPTAAAVKDFVDNHGGIGGGDVTGPSSSTNENLVSFDGTTGKIIQDSGLSTFDVSTAITQTNNNAANILTNSGNIAANATNISNNTNAITTKAPLASPAFTGTPTAPTPSSNDNSTKIATTAYVDSQVSPNNKGVFSSPSALRTAYPTGQSGWYAIVTSTDTFWIWDTGTTDWVDTNTNSGGDVTGPSSSTSANMVSFDGTTGKLIQDSGVASSDISSAISQTNTNTTNIAANASDISTLQSDVSANTSDILLKAAINSPLFTGNPAATTPSAGDNSTRLATTAYTDNAISSISLATTGLSDVSSTSPSNNQVLQFNSTSGDYEPVTLPADAGGTVTSITAGVGLDGGTITGSGTIDLANTSVSAGSFTNADITVDAQGRITSAANGASGGTGDVTGPSSATDSNIALFDGTTGKIIKDGGALGSLATKNTVGNADIDSGAVDTNELASDAVTTPKIINGAVTNDKLDSNIDAAKLADGTVSDTEFQYINSVTSNVQDQLDAKGSGTVTSIATGTGIDGGVITGSGTISLDSATQTTLAQVSTNVTDIALKANIASPALTGTPTAPTQSAGDDSTKIATTAYVDSATATRDQLSELTDVTITSIADADYLIYDATSAVWENKAISGAITSDKEGVTTLASGIDAAKISAGNVSNTEFDYLNGVTSAIQTQIDTNVGNISANTINISNNATAISGKISASSTDTLTNKTIDADDNTLSNIEVDNFKATAIVTESEGIASNDNDTTLPTSAAVKDYVDSTAGGTGTVTSIDVSAGTGITSSGGPVTSSGSITVGLDTATQNTLAQVSTNTSNISSNTTAISNKADAGANSDITALTGLTTALSVAQGGTGATTASAARTSLGLGSLATQSSVTDTDIAAGVNADKISSGSVSNTEFDYLNGVTSAIQTQIDAKAPLASPALTGTPTAPTPAIGDASTKIATTDFVDTELGLLSTEYLTDVSNTAPTNNQILQYNSTSSKYEPTTLSTGSGDVTGPSSSTSNNVAAFDGATGKIIKDSGKVLDDIGRVILQRFTSSGTGNVTAPSDAIAARITAYGGGGGGAGAGFSFFDGTSDSYVGGGGGGGASGGTWGLYLPVSGGSTTFYYNIGSGGTAGAGQTVSVNAGDGGYGGSTTIGIDSSLTRLLLTASGGAGGYAPTGSGSGSLPDGGAGGGGMVDFGGGGGGRGLDGFTNGSFGMGGMGNIMSGETATSSGGGAGGYQASNGGTEGGGGGGVGGGSGGSNGTGSAGTLAGGGGGGSGGNSSGSLANGRAGGAGGNGYISIEWQY